MSDGENNSLVDSPKKAYRECSQMIRSLNAEKKLPKSNLSEFIDLNKKQHYMPRRYDVSEMQNPTHTIHEILEEDEAKITMIDNKISELEPEYIKKLSKEVKSLAPIEKSPKRKFRKRPLNRNENDFL